MVQSIEHLQDVGFPCEETPPQNRTDVIAVGIKLQPTRRGELSLISCL